MRILTWSCVVLLAAGLVMGCRSKPARWNQTKAPAVQRNAPTPEKPIVTPAETLTGKIARVHGAGKFVVIVFPVGQLPRMEQRLGVYRDGLKVGDVKITGPQLDDSVVADITAGEVKDGDIVRE